MCRWALLIAVLAGVGVRAADKPSPIKAKEASSPEEAVQFLAKASQAGDLDGYLAQTAEPTRSELVWTLKVALAQEHLDAALDKKFGPPKPGDDNFIIIKVPFKIPTVTESLQQFSSHGRRCCRELVGSDSAAYNTDEDR